MQNLRNQKYEIIGSYSRGKHKFYKIRFISTGSEKDVRGDILRSGRFKDNYSKTLLNIGSIGNVNTRQNQREYKLWHNMIYRCYDPKDKAYIYYGGRGVRVCDRWLVFENFLQDIHLIDGYNDELFHNGLLELDKDIKSDKYKLYSLSTCKFVSCRDNQKQRAYEHNTRNKKFAIFPDGHVEQIFHVSDFCKQNGLHRQNVNLCLSGKQKQTKGFAFYRIAEDQSTIRKEYTISEIPMVEARDSTKVDEDIVSA